MKKFLKVAILSITFSFLLLNMQVVLAQDVPGTTTPGTTTPGTTTPGTTTPGTTTPGTTTPGTTTPGTTIPGTTTPGNTINNVDTTNNNDWGRILLYGIIGAILGSLITYAAIRGQKVID